ncbi:MAG: uroporphyrinogen-III synthase, partial [Firmicutes bacterium]|nr:uroporphyrinogen-III synthase [Bacillota bacterium]
AKRILDEAKLPYTFVTFTSASCVEGFVKSLGEKQDYSQVKAVCIGAKTAERAGAYGMQLFVSEEPSVDSMIRCLESIM